MIDSEITYSWLRYMGFTRYQQPAASNILSLKREGGGSISVEIVKGIVTISLSDGDTAVYLPQGMVPLTRLGLINLWTSLGIKS